METPITFLVDWFAHNKDPVDKVLVADMKLPEDFELKFIQPKFWRSVGSESGCTGVLAGQ